VITSGQLMYQFNLYGMGFMISEVSVPDFKAYHFDMVERNVHAGKIFFEAGGKWA